jgi:hypothetical protein
MTSRMQQRRDTAANWTSNNPTLANGEIGIETDTKKMKVGDGTTAWTSLAYAATGTVTSITAGTGLSGGTISSSGTIALSTPVSVANGGTGITSFGSGVATFLGTPTSANLAAALTDETGTGSNVFATSPTLTTPILTQGTSTPTFTTNAYTIVSTDAGLFLLASNSATAGTISIPTDATWAAPNGTQIHIQQTGSGQLTIQAATSGTTTVTSVGATAAAPKLRVQYSVATLVKTATNAWTVMGDIA